MKKDKNKNKNKYSIRRHSSKDLTKKDLVQILCDIIR